MADICNLPDDVLCDVLSFLPSKEACATTALSTRWRSLWTMVPVLQFKGVSPVNINAFLKQRRITHITSVVLEEEDSQQHAYAQHIHTWVSSFIAGKVQHLHLSLSCPTQELPLPPNLFCCVTLVTLKLKGSFFLNVPASVHLPCLKSLHLQLEEEQDMQSISTLLSGCPVLQDFYMGLQDWLCEDLLFDISVPSLKKLKILGECSVFELLQINTPSLESLDIQSCDIENLVISGELKNLIKVTYYVGNLSDNFSIYSPIQLLTRLNHVPSFDLGDYFDETVTLNHSSILHLPQFTNLVHLQLTLREGYFSHYLIQFLIKCPKLQVLIIDKESCYTPKHMYPTRPVSLSPHLTLFEHRSYSEYDLPLVKFILKSAKAMKLMKINAHRVAASKRFQMKKQILKLLKSSSCLCEFI